MLFVGFFPLVFGCYSLEQAVYYNDLYNSRVSLEEAQNLEEFDEKTKAALAEIQKIAAFAKTQGLFVEDSYKHFIPYKNSAVSFLVQASQADRFAAYKWWFPFAGEVPYLGFYNEPDRDSVARSLESQGYDVYTAEAGAFSSLGWFEDPVFYSMTQRSTPRLVHLIFHELTHRTLWIQGSVRFNENLAEFIAEWLTPLYLEKYFPKKWEKMAKELKDYRQDKAVFKSWLADLKGSLVDVYQQEGLARDAKLSLKEEIIKKYTKGALKPTFAHYNFAGGEWNNARILSSGLYIPDLKPFEKARACLESRTAGEFLIKLNGIAEEFDADDLTVLDLACRRV